MNMAPQEGLLTSLLQDRQQLEYELGAAVAESQAGRDMLEHAVDIHMAATNRTMDQAQMAKSAMEGINKMKQKFEKQQKQLELQQRDQLRQFEEQQLQLQKQQLKMDADFQTLRSEVTASGSREPPAASSNVRPNRETDRQTQPPHTATL
jgi:hypothetical protein